MSGWDPICELHGFALHPSGGARSYAGAYIFLADNGVILCKRPPRGTLFNIKRDAFEYIYNGRIGASWPMREGEASVQEYWDIHGEDG
jgi:hypothetical protein